MTARPVIVGNWKMQLSHKASVELARSLKKLLSKHELTGHVVVCPSYPSLPAVQAELSGFPQLALGAQHVHWEERGAWTGEVSVAQIRPFVRWCIVGHSEQRLCTELTDERVSRTAALLIRHGIAPVVCLGETAQQRAADETVAVISRQMRLLLAAFTRPALSHLTIAYEPIWAISANEPAMLPEPMDTAGTLLLMRKLIANAFDDEAARRVRLLYGGSVTAATVGSYVREPGVDGVLVGSASTHPMEFAEIVRLVEEAA